jgi:DNA polymerase-4
LVFVPPRFDVYKAISLQIRSIFAEYTSIIEPLSLDEAYLDVTENLKGIASATEIAADIRAKIRRDTNLTASAGVSYNKFLAKLASDHRKPDGLAPAHKVSPGGNLRIGQCLAIDAAAI